ncbi:MAG: hypothetical protein P8X85_00710 [Desulfobacterales bacterium]|jgi:hypothetical protein
MAENSGQMNHCIYLSLRPEIDKIIVNSGKDEFSDIKFLKWKNFAVDQDGFS